MSEQATANKIGDPSALGLISYGIALASLSLMIGAGFHKNDMIMSVIVVGAVGIGISSLVDFVRGQTFGGVAFGGWAIFFWAFTYLPATPVTGGAWHGGPQLSWLGWYFCFWAVFGLLTLLGSIVAGKWMTLRIALFLTTLMLVLAAFAHWMANPEPNATLMHFAAWSGVVAAAFAAYTAFAALLNEIAGKKLVTA
jgi:succinate-acetate transporter protein